ncbi:uncharacterized protein LOC143906091 [Temnothorax americanus]|uniref:uncharacterized protein LOC143906091 n=1 Tax=Temnothorax americanus TaxID=1964332 RepID=UPI0040680DB6
MSLKILYSQSEVFSTDSMPVLHHFALKRVFSGAKTVEVASYFAANIFNHGYESILQMMDVLNLQIGPNAVEMCDKADELRIAIADKRSFETSKQERINRRIAQSALEENFYETIHIPETMYTV